MNLRIAPLLLALSTTLFAAPPPPKPFAAWSPKPPMGWNSYDCYHGSINEAQFRAAVDYLAEHMLPLGYEYLTIDFLWFHPGPEGYNPYATPWRPFAPQQKRDPATNRMSPLMCFDAHGRPLPAPNRFPSAANGAGFKPLADYVHSKGMKFGLHIMRGIPTQVVDDNLPILGTNVRARDIAEPHDVSSFLRGMWQGVDHTKPGAQEYYDSLFQLFADWGVDFIKADDITQPYYHRKETELMRRAIDKTGRPMLFSLSYGEAQLGHAWHLRDQANLFRVSADFWDHWPSLFRNFELMNAWSPFSGQGIWPDADMIPFGRLCLGNYPDGTPEHRDERDSHFTEEEHYALMSLWCIARSPLIWGGAPLESSAWSKQFLTNPEIIAVNQNSTNNRQISARPQRTQANQRIWYADIPGSDDKYIGLFNLSEKDADVTFLFDIEYLSGKYRIRDLWKREDLGVFEKQFTQTIKPHGGRLYRLTPVRE